MQETQKHLNFLISKTGLIINNYDKAKVKIIVFFYLGLCERLNSALKALSLLLEAIEKEPSIEFSAGLIVRTLLLDFLIGLRGHDLYFRELSEGKQPEQIHAIVLEYCNSVFADGVIHAIKYFRKSKEAEHISEDQLIEMYRTLSAKYPAMISSYNDDKIAPKSNFPPPPNVAEIYRLLSSGSTSMKQLAKYYETYAFYSKYEHFNIMSFDLMRRFDAEQQNTLKNSLDLMVLHLHICADMILKFAPDNFIKSNIEEIESYLKSDILKVKD